MKWLKRNSNKPVKQDAGAIKISMSEPFWKGDDGVAMEQCSAAVTIAARIVDPLLAEQNARHTRY